jgi:hypothetical protein
VTTQSGTLLFEEQTCKKNYSGISGHRFQFSCNININFIVYFILFSQRTGVNKNTIKKEQTFKQKSNHHGK